jgi:hypothetical protein
VRGFASHFEQREGKESLQLNDVVVAVNDLDAQNASFDAIIEKFRWQQPQGDWCGLQAATISAANKILDKTVQLNKNETKEDPAQDPHEKDVSTNTVPTPYLSLTTPEQDLVASYPLKLSRVEDVVCIIVARVKEAEV